MRARWITRLTALLLSAASASAAWSQPVPVAPVTPPARVDMALRGQVLAGMQVDSHPACQSECKRVSGCTGYNLATGSVRPPQPMPGMPLTPAPANCTLLAGTLTDAPVRGVISCRMPCTATGSTGVAGRVPVSTGQTGAQGGAILRPPKGTLVPATPAPAAPVAGAVLPVVPPLVMGGTYTPPRAAVPAPAPAPRPTPVARSGVSGYEVVLGPEITLAPLASATATALCASGKVALSAGYRMLAGGDASFGLEVRGLMPEGREARVLMRNANVFEQARVRAMAVCVNAIAGLRAVDSETTAGSNSVGDARMACAAGERVVGGGAMGTLNSLFGINAPAGGASDGAWLVKMLSSTAAPGMRVSAATRALCAPEAGADGWEIVRSASQSLGAHSQTTLALSCPTGKALLAAGLTQGSNNLLDMVSNTLQPQDNTLAWQAHVHNRNTINGSGHVDVSLAAVCVRRQ